MYVDLEGTLESVPYCACPRHRPKALRTQEPYQEEEEEETEEETEEEEEGAGPVRKGRRV
jgi:ribosomal protein L12E/L44/L45/RPP1/RPP2